MTMKNLIDKASYRDYVRTDSNGNDWYSKPLLNSKKFTDLMLEDILFVLREEYKEAGPRGKELIHKLANKYKERYK